MVSPESKLTPDVEEDRDTTTVSPPDAGPTLVELASPPGSEMSAREAPLPLWARAREPRRSGPIVVRWATAESETASVEELEIVAHAGSGGMGDVYRAVRPATGASLALKLLASAGADRRRFAREAAVLASFRHPGVVTYEGHGVTEDGAPFLAMEWLDGEDLEAALGRGRLGVKETLALAQRLASALGAAHLRGIVHRDIKPANVLLVGGKASAAKLLDFGLARAVVDSDVTVPGTVLGTPAYMSPEQIRGLSVDARADVYGLGAVIYRCLAGHAPFEGAHRIAVLAKVLVDDAAPLARVVGPEVTPGLDDLVARMLAKAPEQRPADGAAVALELRELDAFVQRAPVSLGITAREQRVACVVLAAAPEETAGTTADSASREDVRVAVAERGGALESVARGTSLVTIPGAASPAEQAARAARCALALASADPVAPIVVATGRVVAAGDARVGEVIDRAAAALVAPREGDPGGVLVDEGTSQLLDDRFELAGAGPWRRLLGERSRIAPVRTFLGRPTACVGRAQELATLTAALEECANEPRALAVLLTGAPGLGKSRLVHELVRAAGPRDEPDLLFAHGDAVRVGSPYGVASRIVRGAAGILDSDPAPVRAAKLTALLAGAFEPVAAGRIQDLLGEICGARTADEAVSPALRAARADATVMGDAVREAWIDWLRARASSRTVMIVVEDLQWADAPSVRLLDAGLDALADRPLLVLATARPEVHDRFPDLWQKRGVQQLALAPLAKRAAQKLVRAALGPLADAADLDAIVERAAGHPFHLEEIVRAVAAGQGPSALPDSVLGMAQARLDVLGEVERRALRGASVLGETFWSGGVGAIMGADVGAEQVAVCLARLTQEEVITRRATSRLSGEVEYTFRHSLMRDAAYATLTEADRALAHRLAGAWLESVGEADAATLADHYHRGGARSEALRYYKKAATHALDGSDLDRAASFADRALACGPDEASEGAIWAVQAEVAYWRGDLDDAAERASRAIGRLTEGGAEWLGAVSVAIGAAGQRGKNDAVAAWLARAAGPKTREETRAAQAVTLCRGLTQLTWAHHRADLGDARARLEDIVRRPTPLEPYAAGWVHRVAAEGAWLHDGDLDRCRREFTKSCAAFEQARAQRNLCLTQMNWASLAGFAGETAHGLDLADRARHEAKRIGAGVLVPYGLSVRALVEAFAGAPEAASSMRAALKSLGGSPRLAFVARVVLGWLAVDAGDLVEADLHARALDPKAVALDLQPAAFALRARIAVRRGALEEALFAAVDAGTIAEGRRDLELIVGMSDLALAEVHDARGERELAKDAIAAGYARLAAIARTLADPEARARFLERRLANDAITRLASEWGVSRAVP